MGIIYKITNPKGKIYVGKTYDLRKRINAHKSSLKYNKNLKLHNSLRKYGWDTHVLEVIEECEDELMDEREMFWITELKTYCYDHPDGLNMTKGGEGQRSTWMHKTELRKYFSEKYKGENGTFYGRKHTDEAKRIIGEKASLRNKERGITVPKWGAEKGRLKCIKPVVVYNTNGDLVREFESITDAELFLGLKKGNIQSSINRKSWYNGKYFFMYKTVDTPYKIEVGEIKQQTVRRPVYLLSKYLLPLKEYPSALEASIDLGIPKTTINRAAQYNNLRPIRTGHRFQYKPIF